MTIHSDSRAILCKISLPRHPNLIADTECTTKTLGLVTNMMGDAETTDQSHKTPFMLEQIRKLSICIRVSVVHLSIPLPTAWALLITTVCILSSLKRDPHPGGIDPLVRVRLYCSLAKCFIIPKAESGRVEDIYEGLSIL
ncbi:hypothetical protein BD289DRAFT_296228 [Coniella lustricola]|uniref:Uncharacterized protein n=1 Tax=Coniella lustricola TaxID=2025994 RepID=A0A2T3A4X7_9PEZI|nr:hypothetical protein BD289DRAFT_296228 [Coniella lustricola]